MIACERVRFARPVFDPAQPDGIGRTDFARPVYSITIEGGLVTVEHQAGTCCYPVGALAHALVARPAKAVPRGR